MARHLRLEDAPARFKDKLFRPLVEKLTAEMDESVARLEDEHARRYWRMEPYDAPLSEDPVPKGP